jgi:hypothetical protein
MGIIINPNDRIKDTVNPGQFFNILSIFSGGFQTFEVCIIEPRIDLKTGVPVEKPRSYSVKSQVEN